jgi:hypothetical protein
LAAAATTTVRISTRRACTVALGLAFIEVTSTSTYDFHATHSKKLLHNPNTSIYMSFRAAQDHNKAVGRDTISLTASST